MTAAAPEESLGGEEQTETEPEQTGTQAEVITETTPPKETHWSDFDPLTTGNEVAKRFATPAALLKSYEGLQTKLHADGLKVPGKKASKADWSDFHKEMGRPDEAGGYFEGMKRPESLTWNDDLAVSMAQLMHELGVPASAGKQIFEKYISVQAPNAEAQVLAQATANEKAIANLKELWGGEYSQRLAEANSLGKQQFGDNWKEIANLPLADGSVLGQNLNFAKGMQELGHKLGEGSMIGMTPVSGTQYTPSSAQEQIDGISESFRHALTHADDPLHEETMTKWTDLHRQANPGE